MDPATAKRMITDVDKARDSYHKHYAKYAPSDYRYKDIMINSALLGVEGTARHLASIVKEKLDIL